MNHGDEFGKVAVSMGRARRGAAERPVREGEAAHQLDVVGSYV
jgi:hypothetical protein